MRVYVPATVDMLWQLNESGELTARSGDGFMVLFGISLLRGRKRIFRNMFLTMLHGHHYVCLLPVRWRNSRIGGW